MVEQLMMFTRDIPLTASKPTEHIDACMCAIHKSNLNKDKNMGKIFEIVFISTLIQYGMKPNNIELNYAEGSAAKDKYCADADVLLILKDYELALMLKTSIRERWKQFDRDAGVFKHFIGADHIKCYGVHWQEYPKKNLAHIKDIKLCTDKSNKLLWCDGIVSIRDYEKTNKLLLSWIHEQNTDII